MQRLGILRCAAAAVLFGASTPFAAQLAGGMSPFTLAGLLYLGAALVVLPVAPRRRVPAASLRRGAGRLSTAVVLGGAVGPVLLAMGLARTSAGSASLLLNLELVLTVCVGALAFREHVGRHVAAGAALITIGSVVLAGWDVTPTFRLGALLVVGACLCWAVDNAVTADLDELSPAQITLVKGAVAGSVNLAVGLTTATPPAAPSVAGALLVGALGYGASITLWVAGARDLGAARAQVVFATAPFVGAGVAWTLLAEPVRPAELLALVLAATGVALVTRSDHVHHHVHDAVEHDHEHVHDDGHHDHVHPDGFRGRHQHRHAHAPVEHAHAHVPDLHHRHTH